MSLLPYFFDDFGYRRPRRLPDQHFGLAITPNDLLTAVVTPSLSHDYFRPWRQLAARDIGSSIKADKDQFQITLDVQHFGPEDISVKTADGYIVVEGRHEERKDAHGLVARSFSRRYKLPEGVEPDAVVAQLSADGVLSVKVPRKPTAASGERAVTVERTGPVRKQVSDPVSIDNEKKEHKNEDSKEDKKEEKKEK